MVTIPPSQRKIFKGALREEEDEIERGWARGGGGGGKGGKGYQKKKKKIANETKNGEPAREKNEPRNGIVQERTDVSRRVCMGGHLWVM